MPTIAHPGGYEPSDDPDRMELDLRRLPVTSTTGKEQNAESPLR